MQEPSTSDLDDNDIHAPFPTLGESRDNLRRKLQLANYCRDWTFNPANVLRRLRFLRLSAVAVGPIPPASAPRQGLAASCDKCAVFSLFDYGRTHIDNNGPPAQPCVLRLTNPGELEGCNHYVAVSYCWRQPWVPIDDGTPALEYVIMDGDTQRKNRVPPNILRRAMSFATQKKYRLIWIDQECIEQDNPQDKALHIQAMHLIFRQAGDVVAVLNNALVDQLDLYRLSLGNRAVFKDDVFLTQVIALAQWLASDSWYTRAWTYQEALLATRPVYLLIPCRPTLRPYSLQTIVDSQLMILDTTLVKVLQTHIDPSYLEPFAEILPENMSFGPYCSALDVIRGPVPAWKEKLLNVALDYHRLSALDALSPLVQRNVTETFDLIVLCGNLCNYSVRLDTEMVHRLGIGLSAAVFALALLNGDLSLLLATDPSLPSQLTTQPESSPPNSFRNLVITLRRHEFIDLSVESIFACRIRPPQLVPGGLLIKGILWRIEYIDSSTIRQKYHKYKEEIQSHFVEQEVIEGIIDATCQLLREQRGLDLPQLTYTFERRHRKQHFASRIMRYDTIAVAAADSTTVADCILLPGLAHEYAKYEFIPSEGLEGCVPLFGVNKVNHLFTPYRVLMGSETEAQQPRFLLAWAISDVQTPSETEVIHIHSQKWPCKLKLDEVSFLGDSRHFLAGSSQEERSYWLHCF